MDGGRNDDDGTGNDIFFRAFICSINRYLWNLYPMFIHSNCYHWKYGFRQRLVMYVPVDL